MNDTERLRQAKEHAINAGKEAKVMCRLLAQEPLAHREAARVRLRIADLVATLEARIRILSREDQSGV
jgi:hypothetical protein